MGTQGVALAGKVLVLAIAAGLASCVAAAPPVPPPAPLVSNLAADTEYQRPRASLAGQFLVATPRIEDPRFARTVVYMVAHDEKGAMGLVVNRAFGEGPLKQLLIGFGVNQPNTAEKTVRLYYGGPVEPERGFVLHSPDYRGASTQRIDDRVSLSTGKDVLEAIAAGRGPAQAMFIIGYAGWGSGQLEREMARDDWLTAPGDPALIFTDQPDATWRTVYRAAGLAL